MSHVTAGGDDYEPTPSPMTVALMRGQDVACSNITINNDLTVEENKEFNVSVAEVSHTFAAGVNILRGTAVVSIEDDDGESDNYIQENL